MSRFKKLLTNLSKSSMHTGGHTFVILDVQADVSLHEHPTVSGRVWKPPLAVTIGNIGCVENAHTWTVDHHYISARDIC